MFVANLSASTGSCQGPARLRPPSPASARPAFGRATARQALFPSLSRRIRNAQLLEVRLVLRRVEVELLHLRPQLLHQLLVQPRRRLVRVAGERRVGRPGGSAPCGSSPTPAAPVRASAGGRGRSSPRPSPRRRRPCARSASPRRSRSTSGGRSCRGCWPDSGASPSAPTTTRRRCRPSPPPRLSSGLVGPPSLPTSVCSPCSRTFMFRCTSFANAWSASLHFGIPTFWMFAYIVSATVLFMCCGHADPSKPPADLRPGHHGRAIRPSCCRCSHISLMCG